MKKILLLIALFYFGCKISYAQPGSLDLSFGRKGWITEKYIPVNNQLEQVLQVFPAEDGSYIAIIEDNDYFALALARFFSNGTLDKSYGSDGYVLIDRGKLSGVAAAQQSDGKILIGGHIFMNTNPGSYAFNLYRYNIDGSLDSTFDGTAKPGKNHNFGITLMAVQSDGKIIVTGSGATEFDDESGRFNSNFAIARYNNDGSLDDSFGQDGILTDQIFQGRVSIKSFAEQNDGKIIIGATIFIPVGCERCPPDEGGNKFILLRYNNDGTLDQAYGQGGNIIPDLDFRDGDGNILIKLSDEKLLITGTKWNGHNLDVELLRYNSDGSPDLSFNSNGPYPADFGGNDFPSSIAVRNDGKIVISVWPGGEFREQSNNFALVRYNNNGTIDSSFDGDGKVTTNFGFNNAFANSILMQSDGKLLAAGGITDINNWDFAFATYNDDGSLDNKFSKDGKETGFVPNGRGQLNAMAVQSDGKKVVAGTVFDSRNVENFFIARYNLDGSPDSTFNGDGKQSTDFGFRDAIITSLALKNDGKIVAAGYVFINGDAKFAIARYNTNGSPDSTFSGDGRQITDFGYVINAVAIQNDGKIVVGGSAFDNALNSNFGIVRYNSNGSLDSTFSGDGKQITDFGSSNNNVNAIAIQTDGKIIAASLGIIRYKTDGSLDNTFDGDGKKATDFNISSLAIQSDGKIVAGGSAVGRYNTDGSPDTSFDGDGEVITSFGSSSINIQNDGKIVTVGGVFDANFIGDISISRLTSSGTFDTTFSSDGKLIVDLGGDERGNASVIFNNKLYVAGNSIIAAFNLNSDSHAGPDITITHPLDRAPYLIPVKNLNISAVASDDGTVTKVEFYNGNTLLGIDSTAPYVVTLHDLAEGNYIFTAKATDNDGLVTTSAPVHISVAHNKPPTVSIVSPVNNRTYLRPANINLEAIASDTDGSITKVEFYNGTKLLQTSRLMPYHHLWTNVDTGHYVITARAKDNWGAVTISDPIYISVVYNQPPTVSIINPVNEQNFSAPATINLQAAATDADGRITKVEFYNGTTLLQTSRVVPYHHLWENIPAGTYTITAVATDNWGAKTTSDPVTITVTSTAVTMARRQPQGNVNAAINNVITLKLAPNPVNNMLNIYTSGLQKKQTTISIISSTGVILKKIEINNLTQTLKLNVASLASGVYAVKMVCDDKILYKQFVKL